MYSKPLLLIQTGSAPDDISVRVGQPPDWFRQALGRAADVLQVVRVFEGQPLPAPGTHCAAIITGSWAMVTDRLDWSEATAHWIRQAMDIEMPLFGVCYGHQLMAHALGGVVAYHPAGLEVGCQEIELLPAAASDPLAPYLPSHFHAHLSHLQTVLTLPHGARALARSAHDPHQIVRYGPYALSTQFHPEFTPGISAACVTYRAGMPGSTVRDLASLLDGLRETPVARSLLQHFIQCCIHELPAEVAMA